MKGMVCVRDKGYWVCGCDKGYCGGGGVYVCDTGYCGMCVKGY